MASGYLHRLGIYIKYGISGFAAILVVLFIAGTGTMLFIPFIFNAILWWKLAAKKQFILTAILSALFTTTVFFLILYSAASGSCLGRPSDSELYVKISFNTILYSIIIWETRIHLFIKGKMLKANKLF